MSIAPSTISPDLSGRRAPALGGFNLTALRLEIRRLTRNRRTVIIAIVVPVVFFLLFGTNKSYDNQSVGLWQCLGIRHDQPRAVRRCPRDHVLRRSGFHRARPGLEPGSCG